MSDTFATLCTVARKAPLSMGFPRQEHWNGLPFPSPGDLPDPGIKPISPSLGDGFFTAEPPEKPFLSLLPRHILPNLLSPVLFSFPNFGLVFLQIG